MSLDAPHSASKGRWFYTLSPIYAFFLASTYVFTYIPRYLVGLGLTATAVGIILGINTAMRMVAMPVWAHLSDRSERGSSLVKVQFALAAIPALAFPFVDAPWAIVACVAAMALTIGAALPILDTVVVREVSGEAFGRVRAFGSFGYGLSAASFGIFGIWASHETIARAAPALFTGLTLVAGAIVFLLPRSAGAAKPVEARNVLRLLANPMLLAFFLLWGVHWASQIPYNLFLVFLCEEKGFGAWVPGASVSAAIVSEVAFLAVGGALIRRVGPARVFVLCVAATALRWGLTFALNDPVAFVFVQTLHGLSFGAFLLCTMAVLDRVAPSELRTSAQSALYVLVFGAGSALGELVSGRWVDVYDAVSLFQLGSAVECVILLPAIALAYIYRHRT